jgi:membrane protease YdiL (CAAX protease family)
MKETWSQEEGRMPVRYVVLASPVVVMVSGFLAAIVSRPVLGAWSWVPVNLVLWTGMLWFVHRYGHRMRPSQAPARSANLWLYRGLALIPALIPLPLFLLHKDLLRPSLVIPWLLFALINAPIEEAYWRRLLLDAARPYPTWIALLFSSAMYALNHPVTLGVNSLALRSVALLLSTFFMGLIWGVVYLRSGSIRATTFSHVLVDLAGLSVPVFLNLYVPGAR